MVSDDSNHILKTRVLATVPSFPCDLEQVIECCRDLCFFICDMGRFLFLPALLHRAERLMTEGFPPPGTVASEENAEAAPGGILAPLLVGAVAPCSGPHLPPLSPPGECAAGACHCVDVRPPVHGVLGVPAGNELSCRRLARKLSLFTPTMLG